MAVYLNKIYINKLRSLCIPTSYLFTETRRNKTLSNDVKDVSLFLLIDNIVYEPIFINLPSNLLSFREIIITDFIGPFDAKMCF